MGMSHVAAAVILFAGFVTAATTAMRAGFDTHEDITQSWQSSNDWAKQAQTTDMTITSVGPQGQNTRIRADNTGETVIDGSKLSVVINGVDKTNSITTRKVETKTTNVWAPEQEIEIIIPGTGTTSVVLAEEHGITELWRS
jgi:archaellum component FlaF (FlaF/FlaG flagellin family)